MARTNNLTWIFKLVLRKKSVFFILVKNKLEQCSERVLKMSGGIRLSSSV